MAVKFTGKAQVLTFNSFTSGTGACITSADWNINADVYKAACAGAADKATVVGQLDHVVTFNFLIDTALMDTVFDEGAGAGTLYPGANAANFVWSPEGTGAGASLPQITATLGTVGNVSIAAPVEGLTTATVEVHLETALMGAIA